MSTSAAPCRALLLDLDGTLLDTALDMARALNRLRAEEQLAALPFATIRPQVSHGGLALVRLGFGVDSGERFERLRARFLALYSEAIAEHTCLFPGFGAVLEALERAHIPWGIVTNKPGWLTRPLLAALALEARAACVVSGDTLPERKPHPAPLLHAARLIGHAPGACLYAGDAERDIVAGRAAGMRTAVLSGGYLGAGDDPHAWGADAVLADPRALLAWFVLAT